MIRVACDYSTLSAIRMTRSDKDLRRHSYASPNAIYKPYPESVDSRQLFSGFISTKLSFKFNASGKVWNEASCFIVE